MDFPKNVTRFFVCNSVRIGQSFRNEVSVERSIFADVVAYRKLNEEGKYASFHWNKND